MTAVWWSGVRPQPGNFATGILTSVVNNGILQCWRDASDEARSRYGEPWLQSYVNDVVMVGPGSDAQHVVSTLAHAVTSTRPKSRCVAVERCVGAVVLMV